MLVGLFILGYFLSIWFYFWGIGPARYDTIESTRPVLVFTLIVAMLGFGGLLIFRSLFGPESNLKERFPYGREIFLVFSGIFGTVIGFYFGAADQETGTPPSLSEPVYANGRVAVEIEGGRPPFIGLLTRDGQPAGQVIQGETRALSFAVDGGCPTDASVTVVDGEGRRDDAEVTCPTEASGGQEQNTTNVADQAAGNANQDVNAAGPTR